MTRAWPAAAVFAACPGGDPGWATRGALAAVFGVRDDTVVAPATALGVWTGALLLGQLPDRADAVGMWLGSPAHRPDGRAGGVWLTTGPAPVLVLTAGRYVSASGVTGAWDLEANTPATDLPPDWLESRVFNLRTLYAACAAKADQWIQPPPASGPTPTSSGSPSSPSGSTGTGPPPSTGPRAPGPPRSTPTRASASTPGTSTG